MSFKSEVQSKQRTIQLFINVTATCYFSHNHHAYIHQNLPIRTPVNYNAYFIQTLFHQTHLIHLYSINSALNWNIRFNETVFSYPKYVLITRFYCIQYNIITKLSFSFFLFSQNNIRPTVPVILEQFIFCRCLLTIDAGK